jgi:hypothetical protein
VLSVRWHHPTAAPSRSVQQTPSTACSWRKFGEDKRAGAYMPSKLLILLALPRGLEPLFSP